MAASDAYNDSTNNQDGPTQPKNPNYLNGSTSVNYPSQGATPGQTSTPVIGTGPLPGQVTTAGAAPSAATGGAAPITAPGGAFPTGGNFSDPSFAAQVVAWGASQPGSDPSLANDPNYWIQKISSGEFGTDPTYIANKMATAWKSGASGSNGSATPAAPYVPGQGVAGMGTVFGAGGATGTAAGNSYYNQLLGISQQSPTIDPNDPVVQNQVQAFSADQTRANRDYLTQAAEKGGPYGNTDAAARSMAETAGQKTSGFQAQLVGQMTAQRIQQIQSALTAQGAALSDSQRSQLQEELSQLQLSQGAYQFDSNLDYLQSPLNG